MFTLLNYFEDEGRDNACTPKMKSDRRRIASVGRQTEHL